MGIETETLEGVKKAVAIITVDSDGDNHYALMSESAYTDIESREEVFGTIWGLSDASCVVYTSWANLTRGAKTKGITIVDVIGVIAY